MLKKIRVNKPYIFIFDFDGTISKMEVWINLFLVYSTI